MLILTISLYSVKLYAMRNDINLIDNYSKNIENSMKKIELINKYLKLDTVYTENKEYNIYSEDYAGVYIDNNGILNIALVKESDSNINKGYLKDNIECLCGNNEIIY